MPLILLLAACQSTDGNGDGERGTAAERAADPSPTVVLETTKGRIVVELDRERAPLSVANFVGHVEVGFYDSLTFHRVRPGFMIQAGKYTAEMGGRSSSAGSVHNEAANGLRNLRGTVAMARLNDPHSATTQFFINLVDNAGLDYDSAAGRWGYAVFGRVVEGMDAVDAIAAVPTQRRGRHEAVPVEPVIITRAYVADE
jgi:cyclophilin family peptidyl-prolyl cis-trans isomerase